jgi:hypothetical protein
VSDAHAYCRAVEAHLCRRNGGHLIRIVGPSFDLVTGWASEGIPLTVACAGIDRMVDRALRKPGRRRPVRIEFCDADVRAAHDEWVRAIGPGAAPAAAAPSRRLSLTQHIERTVAQLTALRGSGRAPAALEPVLAATIAVLDGHRAAASGARGTARDAIIAQLHDLDVGLTQAAQAAVSDADRAAIRREAEAEIADFRQRLAAPQWEAALAAATARLVRLRLGLPVVAAD